MRKSAPSGLLQVLGRLGQVGELAGQPAHTQTKRSLRPSELGVQQLAAGVGEAGEVAVLAINGLIQPEGQ